MGPAQFEGWNGCTQHHALTVSVRDSAALLDVSIGAELGSPYFSPPPARPFLEEVGADPGRLRIAVITAPPSGIPLHPECKKAALDAAKLCQSLGHGVEETVLPIDYALARGAFFAILQVSLARVLDDAAMTLGRPVNEADVEPVTWATLQAGITVSGVTYSRAIATIHQIGLAMAKFHRNYDVILNPTLAKPPIPLGLMSLSQDVRIWSKEVMEFSPYTALYNMTGQPSMSVPLHWTPDVLPVGVMFSARFGEDATLFRLAAQLEAAQPWASRKPKL
jgi:Asp-tRNA(Asn)/Glu-tRNA(Gln) amidotransferase A subunit family amidase